MRSGGDQSGRVLGNKIGCKELEGVIVCFYNVQPATPPSSVTYKGENSRQFHDS
jgi:hypothetical protein